MVTTREKRTLLMFVTITLVIIMSVLGAVLYVRLLSSTISDTALFKRTIAYGFVVFTIIMAGTFAAIRYVDIYAEKHANSYIEKSEIMRLLHNEIKRYNGDELLFLADERNVILLLKEIGDLYQISKLHMRRKVRTSPRKSGVNNNILIDFDSIVKSLEDVVNNSNLLPPNNKENNGKRQS